MRSGQNCAMVSSRRDAVARLLPCQTGRVAGRALGGDVVAKVGDKIFAFLGSAEDQTAIGLKCGDRETADLLLDRYQGAASKMAYIGQHGWNTFTLDGTIPPDEIPGPDRRLVRPDRGEAAEVQASGHRRDQRLAIGSSGAFGKSFTCCGSGRPARAVAGGRPRWGTGGAAGPGPRRVGKAVR